MAKDLRRSIDAIEAGESGMLPISDILVARHALELVRVYGEHVVKPPDDGNPKQVYTSPCGGFKVTRERDQFSIEFGDGLKCSGRVELGWQDDDNKLTFIAPNMSGDIRREFMRLGKRD